MNQERQDEHFKQKIQLEFEGSIQRLQPYKDNLISFYIDKMDSIYIYDPENQQILRIIPVFQKLYQYINSYIILEEQNYLILIQTMDILWKSKCYKLNEDIMFPQPESQIIGVRDQIVIVYFQLDCSKNLYLVSLRTINLQGEILFERKLITTHCLWDFCFDTSFIIIQQELSRSWVFLKNNRRIQHDFNWQLHHPIQNFTHNKNYYLFGQANQRSVNFMVRQNAQLKIIRKISLMHPTSSAKQIGQWLYIRDYDCLKKKIPFKRVNLTNCSVQQLIDHEILALMTRTNNSKYLVYSVGNILKTIEINIFQLNYNIYLSQILIIISKSKLKGSLIQSNKYIIIINFFDSSQQSSSIFESVQQKKRSTHTNVNLNLRRTNRNMIEDRLENAKIGIRQISIEEIIFNFLGQEDYNKFYVY
ncbi:hypothetical protein pb186bvf_020179 [Paramecium bursaria]